MISRRAMMLAGLAMLPPLGSKAAPSGPEDNAELGQPTSAQAVSELCYLVNDQLQAGPDHPLVFGYRVAIYAEARVDVKRDSRSHAAKKVQHWWAVTAPRLKCNHLGFSVRNGHLLKLAVERNSKDFVNDAVRRWNVDLDVVDDTGETVLDFLEAELAKARGTNLEPVFERYLQLLRRAGARKAAAFGSTAGRVDPYLTEVAPRLKQWDRASYVSEGAQAVKRAGRWGYIAPDSRPITSLRYDGAFCFSEGRAAVHREGLWGYVDMNGDEVVPLRYRDAGVFTNGRAEVSLDGVKRFLIDPRGEAL